MKQLLNLLLSFVALFTISSCQKEDVIAPPSNPDADPVSGLVKGIFQLELNLLQPHADDSLDAFITLINRQGQAAFENKAIKIGKTAAGSLQWRSPEIAVEKGTYTMSQLVIKKDGKALYATPLGASRLAPQIQQGLPQLHPLDQNLSTFRPQVLVVDELVGPEDFGYGLSVFERNGITVNLQTRITVGSLVYTPTVMNLTLITVLENGDRQERAIVHNSLEDELRVKEDAVRYEISGLIWNVPVKVSVTRQELLANNEILLEAEKSRKWLSMEETYLEVLGSWQNDSKTIYQQRADGQLGEVIYYQKKPQSRELQFIFSDKGVFAGNQLIGVDRIDPANKKVGETRYEYGANGRITHILQTMYGQTTTSVIEQGISTEGAVTDVYMLLDNGHTIHYAATFNNGNKVSYTAASSKGASENARFFYDEKINPRATNKLFPDMYLTNVSKNNMAHRELGTVGSIPTAVPYKYEYIYNEDGYPDVLYTYYQSYGGEHQFRKKTVFTYSN